MLARRLELFSEAAEVRCVPLELAREDVVDVRVLLDAARRKDDDLCRLYLGIADGAPIARVCKCRYSK